MHTLFHLAYHIHDLEAARQFYGEILGCKEGRSTATWVDFDFFGHQISLHLGEPIQAEATGIVGEHRVPIPHLGLILEITQIGLFRAFDTGGEILLNDDL